VTSRVRGLSPILSTMILLTAALLAGILLYNYFSHTLQGMMNTPNPVIEGVTYYPDINVLMVKIRNLGGAPIFLNNSSIVILGKSCKCECSITCSTASSLEPGKEIDVTIYFNDTSGVFTGTVSNGCSISCKTSTPSKCLSDLSLGVARIGFKYVYAGAEHTTRLEQVIVG